MKEFDFVAAHLDASIKLNTSPESLRYERAYRSANTNKGKVNNMGISLNITRHKKTTEKKKLGLIKNVKCLPIHKRIKAMEKFVKWAEKK